MSVRARLPGIEPVLFLALGSIWGSAYLAVAIADRSIGPLALVAVRLAIGGTVLAAIVRWRRVALPDGAAWPHIAVVAVTGLVIPFTLIAWSELGIDAGVASIFNAATPLITVALAATFLADESLSTQRIAGVAIGFVGVLVVVGGGIRGGGEPLALLGMVGAASSYAVTAVWTRRFLKGRDPLGIAAGQVWIGAAIAIAAAVVADRPDLTRLPLDGIAAIAWLGVVASGAAPLIFFRLIAAWGAMRTTTVNNLIPVVGLALGALALREQLNPVAVLGALLVGAGAVFTTASLPVVSFRSRSERLRQAAGA